MSSVLVAARASAMRACSASVPVGSRRTPDSSGCAASLGSRAERKGVSAVAESAWVAGRSNAVAGGRVAQALSASAVSAVAACASKRDSDARRRVWAGETCLACVRSMRLPACWPCADWDSDDRDNCLLHSDTSIPLVCPSDFLNCLRWLRAQRRISRVYSKDHARSFYGKSATNTADGSIGEKVERATKRLLVPFLVPFLAAGIGWFNAGFASARNSAIEDVRNRDRGRPRGPTPHTPPCVRVRTRQFGSVDRLCA